MSDPKLITGAAQKGAIFRQSLEKAPGQSLESLLVDLCAFGEPRVSRMDKGWSFSIKMHVVTAGASFDVRSDFDCPTPSAAVRQGMDRMAQTLKEWT